MSCIGIKFLLVCLCVGGGRTSSWGSKVVNYSLFENEIESARDFRVRQSPVLVVVAEMVVFRGSRAKHQYARRLYPHDVLR
jgi:hypothetical protein